MFHKAAETTYNINNAFGSGTGMNVQCSSGSRSFAKETRVLKMRSAVAAHQKGTTSTVLWLFGIWSKSSSVHSVVSDFCSPMGCSTPGLPVQIRKVKKLDEWVPHELTINPKKIAILKCHLLLFYTTANHFLMDCDVRQKVDFIWQLAMISSVVGPRRSSKALCKAKLALKKGHGHCMVVCCWSDQLQLSESQWNHYFWEVCSANQWDVPKTAMPEASIGQQKWPNPSPQQRPMACHTINASKLNELGYEVLPHPPYSPDLLPTNYHFFKYLNNFFQGKRFCNQREVENALQELIEFQSRDFFFLGIFILQE